ncbi:MAG: ATP-binding protein [Chthoniobacterales bacterium]
MKPPENIRFLRLSRALFFCICGFLYFCLSLLCIYLASQSNIVATVWLPGGIAAAAITRFPKRRRASALAITGLLILAAYLIYGYALTASIILTAQNFAEIVVGIALISRFNVPHNFPHGIKGLILGVAPSMLVAPLVGFLIGALGVWIFRITDFPGYTFQWYLAHVLGMFAALPFCLAITRERLRALWNKDLLILVVIFVVFFVLITGVARQHSFPPVLLLNLVLVIAALMLPLSVSFFLNLITLLSIDIVTTTGIVLQTFAFHPGFDPARYAGIILIIIPSILVATLMESIRRDKIELLAATSRAKLSEDAKSMFLAAMSHEIRSPLNSILGFASLLWDTGPTEKSRELIKPILTGGEVLLNLINDILDYSKIEAGRIDLENNVFSPTLCVRQVEELFSQKAREKNLNFKVSIDSAVPAFLMGDANRLKQVLINLTSNAIKFTTLGVVEIQLTSSEVEDTKREEAAQHLLHFKIEDTGIGIPEDKYVQIFERFAQVDSSTSRQFGGTGLGLAISKSLIEAMGGRIWVESEMDKGSIFHFEVPFSKSSEPRHHSIINENLAAEEKFQIPKVSKNVSNLRILVVDDNESNSKLITLLLKRMGCEHIVSAKNGIAALMVQNSESFDVILMDCQMPVMDGFEATREIRRLEQAGRHSPRVEVIALTAAVLPEDRRRAEEAGMDDFLTKPIRQWSLSLALEKALERLENRQGA